MTLRNDELDALPLLEGPVALTLDRAEVNEQVRAALAVSM